MTKSQEASLVKRGSEAILNTIGMECVWSSILWSTCVYYRYYEDPVSMAMTCPTSGTRTSTRVCLSTYTRILALGLALWRLNHSIHATQELRTTFFCFFVSSAVSLSRPTGLIDTRASTSSFGNTSSLVHVWPRDHRARYSPSMAQVVSPASRWLIIDYMKGTIEGKRFCRPSPT